MEMSTYVFTANERQAQYNPKAVVPQAKMYAISSDTHQ